MAELRYNNQFGTLGTNLSATVGSVAVPNLFQNPPSFQTIVSPDYVKLILDAGTGSFEVAYLTGYTAGSVGGVITRAQESTSAVVHSAATSTWANNPTVADFNTSPTGIYVASTFGQYICPALANASASVGNAIVAVVGDSIGEGLYASDLQSTSFPEYLRTAMITAYGDGGSGWQGLQRSPTFLSGFPGGTGGATFLYYQGKANNMWSTSGTWNTPGGPYSLGPAATVLQAASAGASITVQVRGTSVAVAYLDFGTSFTWTIDGVAQTAPTITNSAFYVQQIASGLTNTTHTVHVVTAALVGGTGCNIINFRGLNSSGVVLDNYSFNGCPSSTWNNQDGYESGTYVAGWQSGGTGGSVGRPADLIIYELGGDLLTASIPQTVAAVTLNGTTLATSAGFESWHAGWWIYGTDISPNTYIQSVNPQGSSAVLSRAATGSSVVTVSVFPSNPVLQFQQDMAHYFQGAIDNTFGGGSVPGQTDVLFIWPIASGAEDPQGLLPAFATAMRNIAESYGAAYIDTSAFFGGSWSKWQAAGYAGNSTNPAISGTDAAHPSPAGHKFMANRIINVLNQASAQYGIPQMQLQ